MTKTLPISFEFFPPNTPVGDDKLKLVVQELGTMKPEFFSVTYGAGGATRDKTLKTVQAIAAAGFEAAPHLSCVGSTREGVAATLATYRAQNIQRIVALRGDLPSGTAVSGEFRYAAELVRFIRETQGQGLRQAVMGGAHARQVRRGLEAGRSDGLHGFQRLLARRAARAIGDAEEFGLHSAEFLHHGFQFLAADGRVRREELEADGDGQFHGQSFTRWK